MEASVHMNSDVICYHKKKVRGFKLNLRIWEWSYLGLKAKKYKNSCIEWVHCPSIVTFLKYSFCILDYDCLRHLSRYALMQKATFIMMHKRNQCGNSVVTSMHCHFQVSESKPHVRWYICQPSGIIQVCHPFSLILL